MTDCLAMQFIVCHIVLQNKQHNDAAISTLLIALSAAVEVCCWEEELPSVAGQSVAPCATPRTKRKPIR